jgi:hypothetical protein
MASSSFAFFCEAASNRPDVFPAITHRLAWLEFRRLFNSLINGPVCDATPSTVLKWQKSKVPRQRLDPLKRWLSPDAEADIKNLPDDVPMREAFEWLEYCHDSIRKELKQKIGPCTARSVASTRTSPGPFPPGFSRQASVNRLCETLQSAPPSIAAALLHGSLADGLVSGGFSDADVLCIVNNPVKGRHTFWEAAQWLFKLNHQLFAINPCMHHGPMIAFADEITCAAEASLPSAIIHNGYWCIGGFSEASYHDSLYENVSALTDFELYFEQHHLFVPDLRNAFDILWWTSSTLILPVLLHQASSGVSIYKRECLTGPLADFPKSLRSTLSSVSEVRVALGRWIAARLPAEKSVNLDANPGILLAEYRSKLRMSAEDMRALGLHDSLMSEVRRLWEHVRARVLEIGWRHLDASTSIPPVTWSWLRPTRHQPRHLNHADYESAREAFVSRCNAKPEVKAVFEFGEVGCPGLSDLDFCVVLDSDFNGTPTDLGADSFPEEIGYIMDHDPLFVSAAMAPKLGAFFPILSSRQLYGNPMDLPASHTFSANIQAAAITHKNLRKYPRDLDWLLSQDQLNIRTILAFLHSANHIDRCLKSLALASPKEIKNAVALDEKLRARFRAGNAPTAEDVFLTVDTCMAYCGPVQEILVGYWLQAAKSLPVNGGKHIPEFGLQAVHWVRAELSFRAMRKSASINRPTLYPFIAEYLDAKRRFFVFEQCRRRSPSVYMEDPNIELFASSLKAPRSYVQSSRDPAFAVKNLAVTKISSPIERQELPAQLSPSIGRLPGSAPGVTQTHRPAGMRITFLNQKGGVGKSTLCIAVGTALHRAGFHIAFDDRDNQGSVSFWATHVGKLPMVGETKNPEIILCDTPGRLDLDSEVSQKLLADLIHESDRLVLVTEKSLFSIHATAPMVRLIHAHKAPEARVYLVLNKVRRFGSLSHDAEREIADRLGVPLAVQSVPLSMAFEKLQSEGPRALRRRHLAVAVELALEIMS